MISCRQSSILSTSRRRLLKLSASALGAALVPGRARARPAPSKRRLIEGRYVPPSLGHEVAYAIHLPPASDRHDADLPILYFLHGLRDDQTVWEREGFADMTQELIDAGKIPPLAVALPDGRRGFYTNAWKDGPREEDAIFPDFVQFTEERLLGRRPRGRRAIAGISMGGYGAFKIALKQPREFAAIASLSGALAANDRYMLDVGEGRRGRYLLSVFGPREDERMRDANDEYRVIRRLDPAAAPAIFLACGTEDHFDFDQGLAGVRDALLARGVKAEVSVGNGRHAFSYWRRVMPEVLAFVARNLEVG
ncbi:MAG: alpha/beta hydrolase-fold protein [Acidobacteriota bacterium]